MPGLFGLACTLLDKGPLSHTRGLEPSTRFARLMIGTRLPDCGTMLSTKANTSVYGITIMKAALSSTLLAHRFILKLLGACRRNEQ